MRAPLAALLLLATTGCGYFSAGTWDDDPKNWGRAFDSQPPEGAVLVHSRYVRYPHFTTEFAYFFELAPNAALARQIVSDAALVKVPGRAGWQRVQDTPEWFAPKPPQAYDVFALAADPGRDYRILVDRRTGGVFLVDRQL